MTGVINNMEIDKLSAFNIIKRGIEAEVKDKIANDIINEQVELLKARLKEELKPILQAVTFERIDSYRDLMHMRDEMIVQIKVNDSVFDSEENKS